jgi:hypothetical protein
MQQVWRDCRTTWPLRLQYPYDCVSATPQARCAAAEDVGAQMNADLRSVRELCDVQERTIAVLQAQVAHLFFPIEAASHCGKPEPAVS